MISDPLGSSGRSYCAVEMKVVNLTRTLSCERIQLRQMPSMWVTDHPDRRGSRKQQKQDAIASVS